MLFDGFTPMFAGLVGLALTAILILGAGIVAGFGSTHFRIVFWVTLGVGLAGYLTLGFDRYGIGPILVVIGAARRLESGRPRAVARRLQRCTAA